MPRTQRGQTSNGDSSPAVCQNADYSGFGADKMEVVEYYANQSYFQAKANAEGVDPSTGVATKFVDNNGWTTQWQTIHQAEKTYDGGDSETSCESCQTFSLWNGTVNIKMPEVEKAYNDTDPSDNEKAWRVENAGISEADILSPLDPETTKPIFPGGFAGKCAEGQMWQYGEKGEGNGWICSGDIPWIQPAMLPHTDRDFIALIVPHTNLMTFDDFQNSDKWSQFESYPQASSNRDELGSLQTLKATCWVGDLNDDPQELPDSKVISDNVDISDSGSPFGIYGEVDKAPNSEYSCNWEYVTTTGEVISNVGTPVPMQEKLGEPDPDNLPATLKKEHLDNIDGLETEYTENLTSFEKQTGWTNFKKVP